MLLRFGPLLFLLLAWFVPLEAEENRDVQTKQPAANVGTGQVKERQVSREEGAKLLDPKHGLTPPVLDLQAAYELAILRSETLGLREQDVKVAEAQYWQALGAVLPNVHGIITESMVNTASSGSGTGTISSSSNSTSSQQQIGGGSAAGSRDRFEGRINVQQPLFSGFRDFNTMAAVKATAAANRLEVVRTRQTLYLDVADVFYQIISYERDLLILDKLMQASLDRLKELDRRVQLGKSRSSEVLTAQTDVAEVKVTVENVKGLLGASRELAAFLTGVPAAQLKVEERKPLPGVEAMEAYLQESGERPDVLAAAQRERASRRTLSAAKGAHWPSASLEGNYFARQEPRSLRDWNIFLTIDIPIFEGGAIEARVRENKALVRQSELNLSQLQRTADREVRTAYHNFVASVAQFVRLQELVKTAEEAYEVQKEDYSRGVSSNLDVLNSLRQYRESARRLLSTEMEARVNLVRLHVAAGGGSGPR